MSDSWIGTQNANRLQNIYLKGFLDISGGNVLLRNGGLTVNGTTVLNNPLNTYSYDNVNFNSNKTILKDLDLVHTLKNNQSHTYMSS